MLHSKHQARFEIIEHSENKIIRNFESEVGPGIVEFIIQQTLPCKKSRQQRQNRNVISFLRFVPLLQACLLKAGVAHSRSDLVSKHHILRKLYFWNALLSL